MLENRIPHFNRERDILEPYTFVLEGYPKVDLCPMTDIIISVIGLPSGSGGMGLERARGSIET